jgi:predicted ester cyclase
MGRESPALDMTEAGSPTARLLEALNTHDPQAVRAVLAPDFTFEEVAGAGAPSIDAFLHEFGRVFDAFPDVLFRPTRETQEGIRTYLEFRAMGTHRGEFLNVRPTGITAVFSGVFNAEHDGDRICRMRMTVDFGGLRRQLLLAAQRA